MASFVSYLPAIASTCSTPISATNEVTARWKLGCIATNINAVTFFPLGKRLQSNVGLSSPYGRRTNSIVVRAETGHLGQIQSTALDEALWKSVHTVPEEAIWKSVQTLMFEMVNSRVSSAKTPWDKNEIDKELTMIFNVLCNDVKVSLMGERILVIEGMIEESGIPNIYETRLLLPRNYKMEEIKSTFIDSRLHITIPKSDLEIKDLPRKIFEELEAFKKTVNNIAIPVPITISETKVPIPAFAYSETTLVSNVQTIHVVCRPHSEEKSGKSEEKSGISEEKSG